MLMAHSPLTRGRVPAGKMDEFVAIGFKSATCKIIINAGNQSSVVFCSMMDNENIGEFLIINIYLRFLFC